MSVSDDDTDLSLGTMFTEPPRPPTPEPTTTVYDRQIRDDLTEDDWKSIKIRLVGTHPLWGHYLWNAARSFASYLDAHKELYHDLSVLELGAGGGLPGIVAAKNGARKVVLTDYPDRDLIENLSFNVADNVSDELSRDRISVQGYIWGHSVNPLLDSLSPSSDPTPKFDLIIMSDLVFNHSQHDALLKTCDLVIAPPKPETSAPPPCLLVFYTHHRPHLAHRDMDFFQKAQERGWLCEEVVTEKFPPMFPEDPGEEEVRSTVHGWRLTRRS